MVWIVRIEGEGTRAEGDIGGNKKDRLSACNWEG